LHEKHSGFGLFAVPASTPPLSPRRLCIAPFGESGSKRSGGPGGRAGFVRRKLFRLSRKEQNLTEVEWQIQTTDAQILNAIRTGPSVMPAFENKLSATEIEALAKYVRTFEPSQ
jgi:hypothetical protein